MLWIRVCSFFFLKAIFPPSVAPGGILSPRWVDSKNFSRWKKQTFFAIFLEYRIFCRRRHLEREFSRNVRIQVFRASEKSDDFWLYFAFRTFEFFFFWRSVFSLLEAEGASLSPGCVNSGIFPKLKNRSIFANFFLRFWSVPMVNLPTERSWDGTEIPVGNSNFLEKQTLRKK